MRTGVTDRVTISQSFPDCPQENADLNPAKAKLWPVFYTTIHDNTVSIFELPYKPFLENQFANFKITILCLLYSTVYGTVPTL